MPSATLPVSIGKFTGRGKPLTERRGNFCPSCGSQVQGNSRFCQNCGQVLGEDAPPIPPQSDSIPTENVSIPPPPPQGSGGAVRKTLVGCAGVFAVIFLVIIIIALVVPASDQGGEAAGGGNQNEGGGGSESEAEPAEEPVEEQDQTYAINDTVNVGDVTYTVTNAENVAQLEDPYGLDEPLTGNFILVSFTFTNEGSEPATVSDIGMYLYDSQGSQYETDTDAAFYLPDDTSLLLLDRVNPGLSQEVQTVYSVPEDAEELELEVTSGLFASESARIDLGI